MKHYSTRWPVFSSFLFLLAAANVSAETIDVWFGTSTSGPAESRGIYQARWDEGNGRLGEPRLAAEVAEPGFLVTTADGKRLYAVCEKPTGPCVAGYQVVAEPTGSRLVPINDVRIESGGACHLTLDRTEKILLTAQYGAGTVCVFELQPDGAIGACRQTVKHVGGSRGFEDRQDRPHPHWVGVSPDNRFVIVPDLGLDAIVLYRLQDGQLLEHGRMGLANGSGPRHFKFHPSGQYGFVVNELTLDVVSFAYDAREGRLTPLGEVSTLAESVKAKERTNSAAEIRVHPQGRFLYASNRGHDSISALGFDESDGSLKWIESEPIRGSWPRNFNLTPSGNWLLAAGRDSNTIAVFAVDVRTGELRFTGQSVEVPAPICVAFGAARD